MEKFKPNPRCKKCGYEKATVEWIPALWSAGTIISYDYIKRKCERCGFEWREETLDKEK